MLKNLLYCVNSLLHHKFLPFLWQWIKSSYNARMCMLYELVTFCTCPGVIARKGLTSLTNIWLSVVATSVHFTSGFVCWKRNSHSNIPSCFRGCGTEWIQCDCVVKKNCVKSDGWSVPEAWKNRLKKVVNLNLVCGGSLLQNLYSE